MRFLSVIELNRFIDNLKQEQDWLSHIARNSIQDREFKENHELITAAEAEILERTLLGQIQEDGCSE